MSCHNCQCGPRKTTADGRGSGRCGERVWCGWMWKKVVQIQVPSFLTLTTVGRITRVIPVKFHALHKNGPHCPNYLSVENDRMTLIV